MSITTDNVNGLVTRLKTVDANLFNTTCICNGLNLVIVNLFKMIDKSKKRLIKLVK